MKKGLFAFLAAVLLALVVVTPAFAAELNDNEQKVYDEFCEVVDGKSWLASEHKSQYKDEARSALLNEAIDLDEAACAEFSDAVKQVDAILAECNSQKEAWNRYDEIVKIVNDVAHKYDMDVFVDADDKEAHVVVKQTGFGLGQTALVAGAAAVVLCGAFYAANKSKLFA